MFFPVMIDLSDIDVLVVGGGKIAYRKVKKLLNFGGRIRVVALDFCQEFYAENEASIRMFKRAFEDTDLDGVDLVYTATDNSDLNAHISDLCRSRKILVNRVDEHTDSSFINMASTSKVYDGQDVLLAVSCFGQNPSLTKYICKKLEEDFLEDR